MARFFIGGLILWGLFVWPLVKVYERLTVGDIRARAGEIGAQRGRWFGYRRWPVYIRLGIFAVLLVVFWGGVALLARDERGQNVLFSLAGLAGVIFLLVWLSRVFVRAFRNDRRAAHAWRRARRFRDLLSSRAQPRGNSSGDPS